MTSHGYETRHHARTELPTHRHGSAYASLVLAGHHVEASADGPITCTPGTLILHPRWHAHCNRFGDRDARVINIELAGASAPESLRAFYVANIAEAHEVFMHAPQKLPGLIALCVARESPALRDWQRSFLEELQQGDLPVSMLAKHAGVSLAHASRAFLKSHGMSPQLLRRELRARRAIALLGEDTPLADIAVTAGFSDQSHLHRTVRTMTGLSPATLRRQIKSVQDPSAPTALQ